MSTLSYDFSSTPRGVPSSLPPYTFPLAFATLALLTSLQSHPLYPLLTCVISWSLICALCLRLSSKSGRFSSSSSSKNSKSTILLSGCILAASICDRAASADTAWNRALVPIAYVLLRSGNAPEIRRWLLFAVTVCGLAATATVGGGRTEVVLGCVGAVFYALAASYMEELLSEEGWETWVSVGKTLGLYLAVGFAVAAVLMENVLGEAFEWQSHGYEAGILRASGWSWGGAARIFGVGVLGAGKWALVPVVVSQQTVMGYVFLELGAAAVFSVLVAVSMLKVVAAVCTIAGMLWWSQNLAGGSPGASQISGMRFTHVVLAVSVCASFAGVYMLMAERGNGRLGSGAPSRGPILPLPDQSTSQHPIPQLIAAAEKNFLEIRNRQSKTLAEAVKEYKRRYHMNPPPSFDKWFQFAKERNVDMIDEYDTIYHTLKPYWGLPPSEARSRVRESMGFQGVEVLKDNSLVHAYIRGGAVTTGGQGPDWQKEATEGMMKSFVQWLPDMDLPFNIHDEPRVVVAYDILHQHLRAAEATIAKSVTKSKPVNAFSKLPKDEETLPPFYPRTWFNVFAHQAIWTHASASCPPDSPSRNINKTPDATDQFSVLPLGFLANTTSASDVCLSPSFETNHGFFDRPNAFNVVQRLYPVFSQSKVSSFNDIIYPSPWYWAGKVTYDEKKDLPWDKKTAQLYWRGSTTGGFSRNGGWKNQHRQRCVATMESKADVRILRETAGNWSVHPVSKDTIADIFNVHFSHIGQCDDVDCEAQKQFFDFRDMEDQTQAYKYKYLLDIDGNAFSGRYHAFLESRSLVFKLAIFREWHDEWIVPWVHYVPLSMQMREVSEVMRWFRYEGDDAAKRIAEQGRQWAKAVTRKEVLEVWFFRLLLEYARVVDDNRETIGFTM